MSEASIAQVNQIELFIRSVIADMEPDKAEARRNGPGRPRILPSLALWAGMLVCVLRGFSSQLAIWRWLNEGASWFYPRFAVSDQAVYKRLEGGGVAPLVKLFHQISEQLHERLDPYMNRTLAPFAEELVVVDETTLDKVARLLPSLRDVPKGDPRLLPGKLVGLFDIRRQQWLRVEHIEKPSQNEKVAARDIISGLTKGSLIIADLGYFAFAWFDYLTANGYFWLSRLRSKTSYEVRHVFYQKGQVFDGIVWLGAYRADKAAYAVRLICFPVGDTTRSYVTNVFDPMILPIAEVARLYARRWDIELAFKLIKRHLNLHIWWSAKQTIILQQVWAVLTISQILQALRLEIAERAGADPFEVSMELLIQYLPQYARNGQDPIQAFIEHGRVLRFIRPSSRINVRSPDINPAEIVPLPPEVVLIRSHRYAARKGIPRDDTAIRTANQTALQN
jgi:hypothetical protein